MNSRISQALFGAGATFALMAVLFGQLPATLYAGNQDQFSWPLMDLLQVYLPYALTAIGLAALIGAMLTPSLSHIFTGTLASLTLVSWMNGSFFVYDFGLLDGQTWKIDAPLWRTAIELAAAAFACGLVVVTLKRQPGTLATFLAAVALAALSPLATLELNEKSRPLQTDVSEITRFSNDRNVLVVLLDGMQSDVFEDALNQAPGVRQVLEGFTHFTDTAGVAQTTYMTLPAVHSGIEYQPGHSIRAWYDAAVKSGSFVNQLADAGYRGAMINPVLGLCPGKAAICTEAGVLFADQASARDKEASRLANMSLFRIAPLPLKSTVYNSGNWLVRFEKADPRTAHFSVEGNSFMRQVAASMTLDSEAPTVKFFHLFSTHMPVVLDRSCRYAGETRNTRPGQVNQAACGLAAFAELIAALQRNGIYDNTAIVLLSDHGSGGWGSPRSIESRSLRAGLRSVANPTLAIKPIGARGPFAASSKPATIAGVAATICQMTGDCTLDPAKSAFADNRAEAIPRRFNSYKWQADFWNRDTLPGLTTYEIAGPVQSAESWRKVDPALVTAEVADK